MKTLFTAPVWWSERAVGSWLRFWFMAVGQTAGFGVVCWLSEWRYTGVFAIFGLVLPLYYLIALRGVVHELHKKPERHENSVA